MLTKREFILPQLQEGQDVRAYLQDLRKALLQLIRELNEPNALTIESNAPGKFTQLNLTDGITAPSAIVGLAQIYVDTADGDLKCRFGDGVTKTLATDT